MKIYRVEQNSEAWFEFRRGKIGGSKAQGIKPLSRGANKGRVDGTAGFWKLLAERVSVAKDGEPDMDRGHRLEAIGLQRTNDKFGLHLIWKTEKNPDLPGLWVSDETEDMYISPDAAEDRDVPTYAAEVKAFDTPKHLQIMYEDMQAKKSEGYNPLNSLPADNQDQAVDYFVINPGCNVLYWTMINDMVALENLEHYVIVIGRSHVEDRVEALKQIQRDVLDDLNAKLKSIEEWGL
jgi:hypothetical protein